MSEDAWTRAVSGAQDNFIDKDELKTQLSIARIAEFELGVHFVEGSADCVLHGDRPGASNMTVFGDVGDERIACWVCTWRGDVFDVIRHARGISFTDAVKVAREYAESGVAEHSPDDVRTFSKSVVTPDTWEVVIQAARDNASADSSVITRFINSKKPPLRTPIGYLLETWRLGCRPGTGHIVMPYFNRDGVPIGYKERTVTTSPVAAKGARLTDFYGAWLDTHHDRVVICEGETDTWTVMYHTRLMTVNVFGLPTGAATRPSSHLLDLLTDRAIVLAFDADTAGRVATERWLHARPDAGVLLLPDGADCSSVEPSVIRNGVAQAL